MSLEWSRARARENEARLREVLESLRSQELRRPAVTCREIAVIPYALMLVHAAGPALPACTRAGNDDSADGEDEAAATHAARCING